MCSHSVDDPRLPNHVEPLRNRPSTVMGKQPDGITGSRDWAAHADLELRAAPLADAVGKQPVT